MPLRAKHTPFCAKNAPPRPQKPGSGLPGTSPVLHPQSPIPVIIIFKLLFDTCFKNVNLRSVNPTAVQWCVGRQKHRSAFAVQTSGDVAASKPLFGPFPLGRGVKQARANASGEHLLSSTVRRTVINRGP